MDLKIQHFRAENFFKLLCDIDISCTNCLASSCQWQSAQVGSPHSTYLCFNHNVVLLWHSISECCVGTLHMYLGLVSPNID